MQCSIFKVGNLEFFAVAIHNTHIDSDVVFRYRYVPIQNVNTVFKYYCIINMAY